MSQTTELPHTSAETRHRLLMAGAEIFAAQGFRGATVRDICAKAGVNIAAINYHFGDKVRLYESVLQDQLGSVLQKYPPTLGTSPSSSPDERLYAFVFSFFLRVLDQSPGSWHGPLMAREMAEPTVALDRLVETVLRPLIDALNTLLAEFLGPDAPPPLIQACAASVVGQILFYRHCQPVISKLNPSLTYRREDLERLARHVTDFSLAGIRAMALESQR
ncbi:MAG: CerR family C-terminal domain-containing protein [Planctomycetes bacterium]|nr:CerR family C-terminal domain-containing protein [Planctomycetota bacterium]